MATLLKFTISKNLLKKHKIKGVAGSSNALRRQGRQRSPNIAVEVEILEIKPLETNKLAEFGQQIKTCDAVIVMYSLTDRISFHVARELLDDLANLGSVVCPVLLLANKMDLCQHRKVSVTEGRELSRAFTQDIITFHEVSVAHCPDEIMRIFTRLLQSISHLKNNVEKLPSCTQSFHGVKDVSKPQYKIEQQISEASRIRKPSVFYVAGRMLNNLMGRNSMPPELPPISRSNPNSPTPNAEGVFSFKKVFKKRSV